MTFAIISLVLSLLAAGGSIWAQSAANKQNQELARENREDQQSYNIAQADKANQETRSLYYELYSPSAKVNQMRNAGLSPGLLYGIGGAGGQSSTNSAQAANSTQAAPVMNPLIDKSYMDSLLKSMGNIAEVENKEADTSVKVATESKVDAEVKLIEEQTNTQVISQNSMKLDNELKEIELKYKEPTQQNLLLKLKAESEAIEANMSKTQQEIKLLKIDEANKQKLIDAQLKQTAQQIIESKAKTIESYASTALKKATTDKEREEINKVIAETDRIVKETELTEVNIDNAKIERAFKAQRETQEILSKMGQGNMVTGTLKLLGESIGNEVDILKGKYNYQNYTK